MTQAKAQFSEKALESKVYYKVDGWEVRKFGSEFSVLPIRDGVLQPEVFSSHSLDEAVAYVESL